MIFIDEIIKTISTPLIIVSIAIILDMLSGVIKASIKKELKSSEFRVGLMKKVLDYILILVSICLDILLEVDYISKTVIYSLIAMEFYSVLENIKEYIPLPSVLEKVLNSLNDKE